MYVYISPQKINGLFSNFDIDNGFQSTLKVIYYLSFLFQPKTNLLWLEDVNIWNEQYSIRKDI